MKKTYKITSFVLALVFCFAAMSYVVFANGESMLAPMATDYCPDHPNAGWGTSWGETPSGDYIHYYTCNVCGFAFDWDYCSFNGYGDCTIDSHCIICYRPRPNQYTEHDFSGQWKQFSDYHYKTCSRTDCFEEKHENHDRKSTFGEVGGPYYPQCSVCGYVFYD